MIPRVVAASVLLCLLACAGRPSRPVAVAALPHLNTDAMIADIRRLASDEFEGRAPGSNGEVLTVQYLTEEMRAAGLQPGNPDGTWIQKVPLVGITGSPEGPLVVKKGGAAHPFRVGDQVVAFSKHVADRVRLDESDLVFAGYGVQAPEYQWDDFKGLDLKGKTLLVLVGDPPVAAPTDATALDPGVFSGKAMTYYGRWTYKFEKAAELGASGVLVIHETGPAGYPFSVVQGQSGHERFDLLTPDKNLGRANVEGWISMEGAASLLALAGQDYQALKALAATRQFRPVPLGLRASIAIKQTIRTIDSKNVIGKLTGSDPSGSGEFVLYSAHWDHLGIGTPVNGDAIYNGALDNASGVAMVLEIARAARKLRTPPKRTMLFVFVTAEEQGLLGSQYYAEFPLYPLEKTLAVINVDVVNKWGRTTDLTLVGLGASELDDYARGAAAEQGRVLRPDAEPEKGFYYRSDHFNFAKKGVPALDPGPGISFVDKPAEFGMARRTEYDSHEYHKPSDQVTPEWDLSGAAEDGALLLAVGYRVAEADHFPEWRPGNEFKATRDKMLGR